MYGTATFTVRLTSQPTANVTLGVGSSDLSEGTSTPANLIFSPQFAIGTCSRPSR